MYTYTHTHIYIYIYIYIYILWSSWKNLSKQGESQLWNVLSLTLKEEIKLALIGWQTWNILFYVLEREMFLRNARLRYFTIKCNDVEYKRMDQDLIPGQLYDVPNKIRISASTGWAYSFIMTVSGTYIYMYVCIYICI